MEFSARSRRESELHKGADAGGELTAPEGLSFSSSLAQRDTERHREDYDLQNMILRDRLRQNFRR